MEIWHIVLNTFFNYLYHSLAWAYDWVAWIVSFGKWRSWTETILPLLGGKNILEIGHGPGHLLCKLQSLGYSSIGIDESWQMVKKAHQKMLSKGLQPMLVRGLAQSLPFKNDFFDCIISTFPTSYALDPQTIFEIYRVLQVHGIWVVLLGIKVTAKSIPYKMLAFLYRITGESITGTLSEEKFLRPFKDSFPGKVEYKWIQTGNISLFYIICSKV